VSDEFEPDTMWECDWTQIDAFKRKVLALKKKYTFISLPEVTDHLRNDRLRMKQYAALTADDGWASLKNIIPWLVEQKIPVTLFLNPLYLDGIHYQKRETEKILTKEDVEEMIAYGSSYITIASHGWLHKDCMKMTIEEFGEYAEKAEETLSGMKGKIPYYAFTFGRFKGEQVAFLNSQSLIPVYMDGLVNCTDYCCIHRELLDGEAIEKM
jgi:peptidoglycan/xylan/chitin deacetylase (PgdA/CDA1 family)